MVDNTRAPGGGKICVTKRRSEPHPRPTKKRRLGGEEFPPDFPRSVPEGGGKRGGVFKIVIKGTRSAPQNLNGGTAITAQKKKNFSISRESLSKKRGNGKGEVPKK